MGGVGRVVGSGVRWWVGEGVEAARGGRAIVRAARCARARAARTGATRRRGPRRCAPPPGPGPAGPPHPAHVTLPRPHTPHPNTWPSHPTPPAPGARRLLARAPRKRGRRGWGGGRRTARMVTALRRRRLPSSRSASSSPIAATAPAAAGASPDALPAGAGRQIAKPAETNGDAVERGGVGSNLWGERGARSGSGSWRGLAACGGG